MPAPALAASPDPWRLFADWLIDRTGALDTAAPIDADTSLVPTISLAQQGAGGDER